MREYAIHEYIKCDLCGQGMGAENNGVTTHYTTLPDGTYVEGVVKVTAIMLNRERTCICDTCRKAILENALKLYED